MKGPILPEFRLVTLIQPILTHEYCDVNIQILKTHDRASYVQTIVCPPAKGIKYRELSGGVGWVGTESKQILIWKLMFVFTSIFRVLSLLQYNYFVRRENFITSLGKPLFRMNKLFYLTFNHYLNDYAKNAFSEDCIKVKVDI